MSSDQPQNSEFPGTVGGDDFGKFLLRQADSSFAPPPAAASSVWRGVADAMVAASLAPAPLAPLATAPSSVVASLAPQKVAISLLWKVGLGVGALGLFGAVGIYAGSMLSPAAAPSAPSATVVPSSFVVSSAGEASTLVATAPSPSLTPLSSLPSPPSALSSSPQRPPAQADLPLPPSDAEKLLEARRAIRSGDTSRALTLLGAVSPNGSMAEERDVLTIEALAPTNKVKAQSLATQFLQQHPHSAYRGRAEAVLAR